MALFTWNDSYSVKVELCDAQHKKLFVIINNLADAMRMGRGQDVVTATVGELPQYTRTHFQQEEALLRTANYPQLASHQEQHRRFIADVEALERDSSAGQAANSIKVLNLLRDWLLNHIQKTDKQYSAHLNAAGIR
ncbi:MAG TPA: bacteriohemerythrin [Acidobacteriaceae bacterium]|nr:bacteriohemerythrin [Acidobacteriaceae bacterium]